jgi:hypothetical protein
MDHAIAITPPAPLPSMLALYQLDDFRNRERKDEPYVVVKLCDWSFPFW